MKHNGYNSVINGYNPLTPEELLTRNYYDNYNFPGGPNPVPDSIEEQLTATNVKGLSTGS